MDRFLSSSTPSNQAISTILSLSSPNRGSPSAQILISSHRHLRHGIPDVLVSIGQFGPEYKVGILLGFARIAD
jgi:hypothetical protein